MNRRQFVRASAGLGLGAMAPIASAAPGVALVLGGGGCRGYGHIGVLRLLEREGLKPGLIVGSSAGSLVGALTAAGLASAEIERLGARLSPNMLRDWVFPNLGIFGGSGIARFVESRIGVRRIEHLPMRFAAVATDLLTGEAVMLDRGEVGAAVQASASAPGLLEPVRRDGRMLVDGNLSAPVPVTSARALGARHVIAVDVTFPPAQASLEDPFDALYQAFSILTRRLALEERARADVIVEPEIPDRGHMSAAVIREHIDAGESAAVAVLPQLRRIFRG